MSVFVYVVSCDSTLELVVGKLNNILIEEKKLFLQFIIFIVITTTWGAKVVTKNRSHIYFDIRI